ncbi:hypothetical protein Zmor_003917 [Zophobas morio]|uniref:Uncharacterized protein n=1 Tax=Zophobas morio TaxID=2755281 RepID=A0AA38HMB4_9CUCU|nr:hypothetical protein Zmor_003917 [Zophobas morio]
MVENNVAQIKNDIGRNIQKLSIEKACQEYNDSVKLTLDQINHQLDDVLLKNCNGLDELAMKIAARTNFLEKNPSFLSCLVYEKKSVKYQTLLEFDDIRITLAEHTKRIHEKLQEIETYHSKLLELVAQNGRGEVTKSVTKIVDNKAPNDNKSAAAVDNKTKVIENRAGSVSDNRTMNEADTLRSLDVVDEIGTQEGTDVEERKIVAAAETKPSMEKMTISTIEDDDFQSKNEEDDFQDCLDKLHHKEELEAVLAASEDLCKPLVNTNTETTKTTNENTNTKSPMTINENTRIKSPTTIETTKTPASCSKKIDLLTTQVYDRVTIKRSAFSNISISSGSSDSPLKYQVFSDILPDVQRRKPTENLHGKLIQQLVASDSLEGFLKLMDRKPTKDKIKKPKKETKDLQEKYTGSLWFFPKEEKKKSPPKSASVNTKISPIPQKTSKASSISAGSTCCSLLVTSSQPCPVSNQERTRKIRQGLSRNKLKYYDLLDDLDHNDLKPIKSEYPRRDNVYPTQLQDAKSYLHRMMQENEKVWKKLLQPAEDRENEKKKKKHGEKKHAPVQKKSGMKTLLEYLTSPEQKYLSHIPQSLIVMPVKVVYDNFPTKEKSSTPRAPVMITDLSKRLAPIPVEGRYLQTSASPRSEPYPTTPKRKAMLEQLRGLKAKNDNIQKNIQKAIDVIEAKMIDLLSSPTDGSSSEAFTAMEQEITCVLQMMNEHQPVGTNKEETKQTTEPEQQIVKEQQVEKKPETKEVEMPQINEVIPPEKDNKVPNNPTTPKIKREGTIVKKHSSDFKHKDEKIVKEEKKPPKEVPIKIKQSLLKDEKKIKKPERTPFDKSKFKLSKHDDEPKRAANIAEGERLLGQVDSVIKKIDSIYNRFYDEKSKSKHTPRQEANFNNIDEFFVGLKPEVETPILVLYKYDEVIPEIYFNPRCFHQASVWHTPCLDYIKPPHHEEKKSFLSLFQISVPSLVKHDFKSCFDYAPSRSEKSRCDYEHDEAPTLEEEEDWRFCQFVQPVTLTAKEELEPKPSEYIHPVCEPPVCEHVNPVSVPPEESEPCEVAVVPVVPKEEAKPCPECAVEKPATAELKECVNRKESTKEAAIKWDKFAKESKGEDRKYDYTLKTFYTLFFSSVFVALNFDYAS